MNIYKNVLYWNEVTMKKMLLRGQWDFNNSCIILYVFSHQKGMHDVVSSRLSDSLSLPIDLLFDIPCRHNIHTPKLLHWSPHWRLLLIFYDNSAMIGWHILYYVQRDPSCWRLHLGMLMNYLHFSYQEGMHVAVFCLLEFVFSHVSRPGPGSQKT